jgi:hypothetical protein
MESNSESDYESVVSHVTNSDDARDTSRPIWFQQTATKDISEINLDDRINTEQQVRFQNWNSRAWQKYPHVTSHQVFPHLILVAETNWYADQFL